MQGEDAGIMKCQQSGNSPAPRAASPLLSFVAASLAAASLAGAPGGVVVEVGEMTLPTYMFSDPNPVPAPLANCYPYYRFDGYEAKPEPRSWRTVKLESDRIAVTIAPEVGGKVWGAVDKKTGVDFVYFNHVAKFRDVSMRGPWSSGGIEFNFGKIGHEPYTSTPVDWTVRTNDDGSVSCFVGGTEWLCRSFWQVEIRLKGGEDRFTTHARWFNASGLPQTYYQWMNAAFHGGGETSYFYPGRNWIGHGGDPHPWPIEEGHDISVYSKNDIPGKNGDDHRSMHVINGDNRYLGCWWPHLNAGFLHENRTDAKYGRKIWMWALSRQGAIWEGLLTDSDGPYVELQSGRCFQQPGGQYAKTPFKYISFQPGVTESFDESWSVVRDRGDFGKVDVRTGIEPRPTEMPADFDWDSAYGLLVKGEQMLHDAWKSNPAAVEALFRESLRRDPCFVPALDALAWLLVSAARYDEAKPLVRKALAVDTYDPDANYIDALLLLAAGDADTARERFGVAAFSPKLRTAALAASSRISLAEGDWAQADALASDALRFNDANIDAIAVRIAAARRRGDTRLAARMAEDALKAMPLCHLFAHELWLCGGPDFTRNVRNEMPERTFTELACWYAASGLNKEAAGLFDRAQGSIIARTLAAHLAHVSGDEALASKALAEAAALPVGFDFPFRRETMTALEWAAKRSGSWKFRYLAAIFCASRGRDADADAWLDIPDGVIDDPSALLFRASRRTGEAALRDIRAAGGIRDGWRVGLAFYREYSRAGDWKSARDVLRDYTAKYPGKPGLELNYARALVKTGGYAEAVAFLEGIQILPSEVGENPMKVYQEALGRLADDALGRGDEAAAREFVAKAVSYPETLGAGRPYRIDGLIKSWPERVRAFCAREGVK